MIYNESTTRKYILSSYCDNITSSPDIISGSDVYADALNNNDGKHYEGLYQLGYSSAYYNSYNKSNNSNYESYYYNYTYTFESGYMGNIQKIDIISCAYSYTNLTSYIDNNNNQYSAVTVSYISYDGTIYINDAGFAKIQTDFYENNFYHIDSTYYRLKVLYPTYLSINYDDYFSSDNEIICAGDENGYIDNFNKLYGEHYTQEEINGAQEGDPAYGKTTEDWKISYALKDNANAEKYEKLLIPNSYIFQKARLIDCTEKFNSNNEVISNNVFLRFPNKEFINYKVKENSYFKYNESFSPNYYYDRDLTHIGNEKELSKYSEISFNNLTGTLALKSEYITNNSYCDITCCIYEEDENFFSPYYEIENPNINIPDNDYISYYNVENIENITEEQKTSYYSYYLISNNICSNIFDNHYFSYQTISFRYLFQKLLPMKYDLKENTYTVYLNEDIENSLKDEETGNKKLANYIKTKISFNITGKSDYGEIKIIKQKNNQSINYTKNGNILTFEGELGTQYILKITSSKQIITKVNDVNNNVDIQYQSFIFSITRNGLHKCIAVQGVFIGNEVIKYNNNEVSFNNLNINDDNFKDKIIEYTYDTNPPYEFNVTGININIGDKPTNISGPSNPVVVQKSVEITFTNSSQGIEIIKGQQKIIGIQTPIIKEAGTNNIINLSLTYSSEYPAIAEISSSGNKIILKKSGSTKIKATWSGNKSYKSATAYYTIHVTEIERPVEPTPTQKVSISFKQPNIECEYPNNIEGTYLIRLQNAIITYPNGNSSGYTTKYEIVSNTIKGYDDDHKPNVSMVYSDVLCNITGNNYCGGEFDIKATVSNGKTGTDKDEASAQYHVVLYVQNYKDMEFGIIFNGYQLDNDFRNNAGQYVGGIEDNWQWWPEILHIRADDTSYKDYYLYSSNNVHDSDGYAMKYKEAQFTHYYNNGAYTPFNTDNGMIEICKKVLDEDDSHYVQAYVQGCLNRTGTGYNDTAANWFCETGTYNTDTRKNKTTYTINYTAYISFVVRNRKYVQDNFDNVIPIYKSQNPFSDEDNDINIKSLNKAFEENNGIIFGDGETPSDPDSNEDLDSNEPSIKFINKNDNNEDNVVKVINIFIPEDYNVDTTTNNCIHYFLRNKTPKLQVNNINYNGELEENIIWTLDNNDIAEFVKDDHNNIRYISSLDDFKNFNIVFNYNEASPIIKIKNDGEVTITAKIKDTNYEEYYILDIYRNITIDDEEEFGLTQIEEMPKLYLPSNLSTSIYQSIKYEIEDNNIADIIYYLYNDHNGDEVYIGNESDKLNYKYGEDIYSTYIFKPKLRIKRNGETMINVSYPGDDVYGITTGLSFKLVVAIKKDLQLSLNEDKFEIERQLASGIDEYYSEDPLSGFQTFQSPIPNVICEESVPLVFEYSSSNDFIGTPYNNLGIILIFDIGTLKITIKLKESAHYHSAEISYQLIIKDRPEKTETILNVEEGYYQIRYKEYIDKAIYRLYNYYDSSTYTLGNLIFETNKKEDIKKIMDHNQNIYLETDLDDPNKPNIHNYVLSNIYYKFTYNDGVTPYNKDGNYGVYNITDLLKDTYKDKYNGWAPIFDIENIRYSENFTEAYVRLNCYVVEDIYGNEAYYIFSKGLTNRLKTDINNFVKGDNSGKYIDKHLNILSQIDELGLPDDTYPTYSENFATYGMQMIDQIDPKESKAFRHAFYSDIKDYVIDGSLLEKKINSCTFYVKPSKITDNDSDQLEKLMCFHNYNDEELKYHIFKPKYTSNNTDEDVEYIFTSSVPEIANPNSNGDVIIYGSGQVKIMIRSTETENFTAAETGFILDILAKEDIILLTKYNKYLYEMDTTLVENVFGCPDFEWNNTDPDAKLIYWLRDGGPDTDKNSYLTDDDIAGLNIDEINQPNPVIIETNTETEIEEDTSLYKLCISAGNQDNFQYNNYALLGDLTDDDLQYLQGLNNSNISISNTNKTVYVKNCKFTIKGLNDTEILTNSPQGELLINRYLNVKGSFDGENIYGTDSQFFKKFVNYDKVKELYIFNQNWLYTTDENNNKVINQNIVRNITNNNTEIIFKLAVYPVYNKDIGYGNIHNLCYFLEPYVDSTPADRSTNMSDRSYHGWYAIDNNYYIGDDGDLQCYSNNYKYCFIEEYKNDPNPAQRLSPSELNSGWYKDQLTNTKNPEAYYNANLIIQHYYFDLAGNNMSSKSVYGDIDNINEEIPSVVYNINGEDDEFIYNSKSNINNRNTTINTKKNEIVYSANYSLSELMSQFYTNQIFINKTLITYDEDGNITKQVPHNFLVSIDEAGNVTIENGLIGHVINVLVKSVETDNFKPKYHVYNIVVRSILDRLNSEDGSNGDANSINGGYKVSDGKKINSVELEKRLFDVRINKEKITFECPAFTCVNNEPELEIKYYIYDGGAIDGNEWYAAYSYKEFKREELKLNNIPLTKISDLINYNTTTISTIDIDNNQQQIVTYTITNRYDTEIDTNLVKIDTNGTLTIEPGFITNENLNENIYKNGRVINVMIYFSETSNYYENCAFYNIKVLPKKETILKIKDNMFSVAEPYPISGIFELPEIKTNNTDEEEIKYYITGRQVGMVDHDPFTFSNNSNNNWTSDGLDTKWETSDGHYADDYDTEKTKDYSPIELIDNLTNTEIIIKDGKINGSTIEYPCEILDGPKENTDSKLLFKLYKNGQIKYQNSAGRYVLNVCVISEETTNFLQGYGFFNLEVEVKPEPTLGIYPPILEVKVGTEDVYLKMPEIMTSNTDESCVYTYEVYQYVNDDISVDQSNDSSITIDDVGTIKITGNIFNNNDDEIKYWIKVITSPTENFCSTSDGFILKLIKKEEPKLILNPNYIEIRHNPDNPNNHDRFIKLPDILCSNTDDNHRINLELTDYPISNNIDDPLSNDENKKLIIENIFNSTIITLKSDAPLGRYTITAESIETDNFQRVTKQLIINVVQKERTIFSIYPNVIIVRPSENDQYVNLPNIKCNNTDSDCKITFVLSEDMPEGNISIDNLNNLIYVKGNTSIGDYYVGISSNETDNFLGVNKEIEETETEIEEPEDAYELLISSGHRGEEGIYARLGSITDNVADYLISLSGTNNDIIVRNTYKQICLDNCIFTFIGKNNSTITNNGLSGYELLCYRTFMEEYIKYDDVDGSEEKFFENAEDYDGNTRFHIFDQDLLYTTDEDNKKVVNFNECISINNNRFEITFKLNAYPVFSKSDANNCTLGYFLQRNDLTSGDGVDRTCIGWYYIDNNYCIDNNGKLQCYSNNYIYCYISDIEHKAYRLGEEDLSSDWIKENLKTAKEPRAYIGAVIQHYYYDPRSTTLGARSINIYGAGDDPTETETEIETQTEIEIETYDVDCQYKFLVSIQEKIDPTISINGGSSEITLTRTVTVGSEIFASLPIEHDNTDSDAKIIYISSDTSVFTITSQGALVVYKNGSADLTVKIPETENFKEATQTITINIVQQTIPSDAFYGDDDYNGNNDDPNNPSNPSNPTVTTGDIDFNEEQVDTPNPKNNWSITSNFGTGHELEASGNSSSSILLGTINDIPLGYTSVEVKGIYAIEDSETSGSMLKKSDITLTDNGDGSYNINGIVLNNNTVKNRKIYLYITIKNPDNPDPNDEGETLHLEVYQKANESISADDSNWPTDLHPDGVKQYNGIYNNGVYAGSGGSSSGNNVFYVNLGGNAQGYCGDGVIYDFFLQNTIDDIPKEQGGDYYRQPVIKITNNDMAVTLSNLTITDGYEADLRRNDNYQSISSFTFSANYSGTGVYVYCPHINAGDNTGKFINFTLSNGVNTVQCHIRIIREDAL